MKVRGAQEVKPVEMRVQESVQDCQKRKDNGEDGGFGCKGSWSRSRSRG